MQSVLVVLILCIGTVCPQGNPGPAGPPGAPPPGPPGPPGDPPGVPAPAGFFVPPQIPPQMPPVVPELPLQPVPLPVPNICYRRFGRVVETNVNLSPQFIGSTQYFYHQCFYYRPSYSECTGGCLSRHRVYIDSYRPSRTCRCCQAQRYQRVPVRQVYCRYIFAYNNGCPPPTLTRGWVARHPDISRPGELPLGYYIVDQCRCTDCPRNTNIFMAAVRAPRPIDPNTMDPNFPDDFVGIQGMDVQSDDDVEGLVLPNVLPPPSFDQSEVNRQEAEHRRMMPRCLSRGPT